MRCSTVVMVLSFLLMTTTTGVVAAQDMNRSYDPVLGELADSDDPNSFAENRGLSYDNGSVTVVIEVEVDDELPDGYSAEVIQKYEDGNKSLVEARIPVENIRNISREPSVRYVRVPSTPVTTTADGIENEEVNGTEGGDENTSTDEADDSPSEDSNGFTVLLALIGIMIAVALREGDDG